MTFEKFWENVKQRNDNYMNIEITSEYLGYNKPITCRCKTHGIEKTFTRASTLYTNSCHECSREKRGKSGTYSHEKFLERLDKDGFDYSHIEFLTKYEKNNLPIKCKCDICNYEWETTPTHLRQTKGCPYCTNQIIRVGYNDFATLHPELLKYFLNPQIASSVHEFSSFRVELMCPDCGTAKEMSIASLSKYGFKCKVCSDGISYPNKLARNILMKLPVEKLKFEYHPLWADNKYYDNYFEYQGKSYILEMDGNWHFVDNNLSGRTKEESQALDNYKNQMAKEHNINVIRINCSVSTLDYIKENILQSELTQIFDLSNIDWIECDKLSQHSFVKMVCNYYDAHRDVTETQLAKIFGLCNATIGRYLKKGTAYGWCDNSDVLKRANKNRTTPKPISVIAQNLDNGETIIFPSMIECSRYLTKSLGIKITGDRVRYYCMKEKILYGYHIRPIERGCDE